MCDCLLVQVAQSEANGTVPFDMTRLLAFES